MIRRENGRRRNHGNDGIHRRNNRWIRSGISRGNDGVCGHGVYSSYMIEQESAEPGIAPKFQHTK